MKYNHLFMLALLYAGLSLAQETVPPSRAPVNVQVPVLTQAVPASANCELTEADQELSQDLHDEIINMLRASPTAIDQYRLNDISNCALASFAYRKKILERLKDSGYE